MLKVVHKMTFYEFVNIIMNKEHVDVLIIGAGPAGLRCAEVLGDSNLRVLVLEKNSS